MYMHIIGNPVTSSIFLFQLRDSFLTDSTVMIGLSHLHDEEIISVLKPSSKTLTYYKDSFFSTCAFCISGELFI